MFCCDQKCVGQSEQTAASQRKTARQRGQLFCDDVVVFSSFWKASASESFILTARPSAFVVNDREPYIRFSNVLAPE